MQKSGFTLLELSIVLVIIGLIIGGITVGQEMIKQAELQRAGKQLSETMTSIHTFRLKYNALPGDFTKASQYWTAQCTDQASPANGCNGNGDGQIMNVSPLAIEQIRAFQHLSLAGMVSGNYTGLAPSTTRYEVAPDTVPAGAVRGSSITFQTANNPVYGKKLNGIYLALSGNEGCNVFNSAGLLSAADAKSLDDKIDDGVADNGILYVIRGRPVAGGCATFLPNCVTADPTASAASFNFSVGDPNCRVLYWYQ
jgi:prepilin-type N-terminal cleavage/methylation domain-containing protein